LGGYDCWTILTPIKSNIFGKLLTPNINLVILGESPYPPTPYPPIPLKGGGGVFWKKKEEEKK
jgi:hypothetical protein